MVAKTTLVKKNKSKKSRSPLSKIAENVLCPNGKNPYIKGDVEICTFKEMRENIDSFSEDEAVWVSEWIHYMGDKKCARDIMKSPKKMKKIIAVRCKKLESVL